MLKKISMLLLRENEAGVVYFVVLVCVLVSIWIFLVTHAIKIQQDVALESQQRTEVSPEKTEPSQE